MENDLPSIPFPICIVPDGRYRDLLDKILCKEFLGTTNIISHTIQGNSDYYTPLIHFVLSKKIFRL